MAKDNTPKIEIKKGEYLEDIYFRETGKLAQNKGEVSRQIFIALIIGMAIGFFIGISLCG